MKRSKTKNIIRKGIYAVLFIALFSAFVYLGEKYSDNANEHEVKITDYYQFLDENTYKVISGSEFLQKTRTGDSIVIIGSNTSKWSKEYIKQIDKVLKQKKLKAYYYDINNDKVQNNSNYYKIKLQLKNNLVTTDSGDSNLLAPSLYIIKNGKVVYYDITTSAVKNTDEPNKYWNKDKSIEFTTEIEEALNKYYLNNK